MALCGDLPKDALESLFRRYGIAVSWVGPGEPIPGSHWGEPEAGLRATSCGATLFVREDTPIHSALHEGGHLVCMDPHRRSTVDTDAGGEDLEECGVCYLQILLADHLPGVGSHRLCRDMDTWGYSFRLGSTRAWFQEDAPDARQWLLDQGLVLADGQIAWHLRGATALAEPPIG